MDWRNTQYTTDCGGEATQPFTVDMRNGEGQGPPDSSHFKGYDMRVQNVATEDLTGDGKAEAAVLLYCAPQPSNFFRQDVQVFTDGPNEPQLLVKLPELCPPGIPLPPLFDSNQFLIRSGQLYPGKLLQAGGSRSDAGNGTLEPVAVSIGPQYGTVGSFRPPGATGTRWSALLAWERGTAPCHAGPEGKRLA